MTALYALTGQFKELEKLSDIDSDMAEAVENTLEAIQGEFDDKAISIIYVSKNMDADITALDNEIDRLNSRKKVITNRKDSLKDYLRTNMEASEISKISCPLFTITLAKGRDIVQIDDADKLPDDYLKTKTTVTPMKKEILSDLKAGIEIEGAILVKSKSSLRIK
jgi:hypothetical protein